MLFRVDVADITKQHISTFINNVFTIPKWTIEIVDNLFDLVGVYPQLVKVSNRYVLKKKTNG